MLGVLACFKRLLSAGAEVSIMTVISKVAKGVEHLGVFVNVILDGVLEAYDSHVVANHVASSPSG
jgi:hypothetical protein